VVATPHRVLRHAFDGLYPVRQPHIEVDVASSEYANVPEPVVANQAAGLNRIEKLRTRQLRYRAASAKHRRASSTGDGTSNAEIGISSSSGRRRPRVARRYLGESSSTRLARLWRSPRGPTWGTGLSTLLAPGREFVDAPARDHRAVAGHQQRPRPGGSCVAPQCSQVKENPRPRSASHWSQTWLPNGGARSSGRRGLVGSRATQRPRPAW
jgi:hypothetical protein